MSSRSTAARRRGLPPTKRMRHTAHFVEEFDARSGGDEEAIGRLVDLASIEPDPNQPRSAMGDLSELVASIRDRGVLEPILVRAIPAEDPARRTGGPSLRIISGERRYRASLEAGLTKVPAIEMEVTEQEAREIALIENLQRKDLTPFEEAEGYKSLADLYDYTHEEISKAVAKSRTVITESLQLLQLSPRVREIAHALKVYSKSVLLEIIKADSEEEQIYLLEAVAKQGLSRDDLRRRFRKERTQSGSKRKKPYVFKFRDPEKSFNMSLSFRQSTVDKRDLVKALEKILKGLKSGDVQHG
ncbi:MAG: ParB/RepB/Spo0J family partition protein [Acidobacteriota bacterium]